MSLYILLIFLFIVFIVFSVHSFKSKKAGAYTITLFSLLFFVGVYCVGILDYTLSGSTIGLKKRIEQIEVTQKELQTIAGTLTKMVLLLEENKISDANIPKASIIIEEYKKTLSKYLGPNFENELKNDIARAKGN
jgi:hypothetical protein